MNRLTFKPDDSSLPFLVSKEDIVVEPETGNYYGGDAINRLAAYEDSGLTPEECKESRDIMMLICLSAECWIGIHRMVELANADREGRVMMLPCKPDDKMLDLTIPGPPDIMKNIRLEVAYESDHGITFHEPVEEFSKKLEKGRIAPFAEGIVARSCNNCTGRFCTQEVLGSGGCCWEEKK